MVGKIKKSKIKELRKTILNRKEEQLNDSFTNLDKSSNLL